MDLSQYGFKKIRDFLIVNDQDIRLVVDLIIRDIKWRNLYVPISQSDILMMEKSNKIKLTLIDGETEPCILIKPNAFCSELKESCTQINYNLKLLNSNNIIENNLIDINEIDYCNYLIYCFEYLDESLKQKGYDTKYTIYIDFDSDCNSEDFSHEPNILNFQLVKKIYKLIAEHYPMKVTCIKVINAKMKHTMALSFLAIRCIPVVASKPWIKTISNTISWLEFVLLRSSFC